MSTDPRPTDIIEIVDENLRQGFAQVPRPVLRAKGLSFKARVVYIALLDYAWQKGSCFPGHATLAADLDVSHDTIERALSELKRYGLIDWKRQGLNKPNVYYLLRLADNPNLKLADPEHAKLRHPEPAKLRQQENAALRQEEYPVEEYSDHHHDDDAVGELTEFGITKSQARKLVAQARETGRPQGYIQEKIEHTRFLVASKSPRVAKSPSGYLVRAIQEDYPVPDGYKSQEQLQADAEAKAQKQAEADATIAAEAERRAREVQLEQERRAQALSALRREHPPTEIAGTPLTTETAWSQVLEQMRAQMSAANFSVYLKETTLVSCDQHTALIVAPSTFVVDWLRKRFSPLIRRQLDSVLGYPVEIEYLALTNPQTTPEEPHHNGEHGPPSREVFFEDTS